ncbi:MAG TPA: LLM class flavin-dependent oxidoreductase [Candidatus Binataceae bacterium]|nr:LLM class flavin-dependent oxidoreductase [Candidatus Binataceae bacterium]
MANRTSFGFTVPQRGVFFGIATWPEMIAMAREADRIALFDSVWVGDSVMAKPRPEAIALLGALSAATSRVKLGVGCMASFPIRDPIVFAYQWATLDLISSGRMLLAACTGIVAGGVSAREGGVWGIKDTARGNRMAENIAICRRLWSEDDVTFDGKYRSFSGVTIKPHPVQQPCPIWIAANPMPNEAEKPLRRVARIADGWMSVNIFPGIFAANWSKLSAYLKDEGKDPAAYPNIAYHNLNLNPDRNAALQESKRFLDEYYGPVFGPQMVEAWTAAGTPAQCAADLRALVEAGAKQITLRITSWDQQGQFQRMVNEVLPLVE